MDNERKIKPGEWVDVEPLHCHQRLAQNTLVSKVRYTSLDRLCAETIFRFVPEELPFFFDHEIDHLPGMLEVNAMRQGTLAMAHLLYDVPLGFVALLDWMEIKLLNYGELSTPTIARSRLIGSSRKRQRITLTLEGVMLQGDVPIMRVTGKLIMLSAVLADKMRRRKLLLEAV